MNEPCGFRTPGGPCSLPPRHEGPHRSPWIPLGAFDNVEDPDLRAALEHVYAGCICG